MGGLPAPNLSGSVAYMKTLTRRHRLTIHLYACRHGEASLYRIGAPLKTREQAEWAVRRLGVSAGYEAVFARDAHTGAILAAWPHQEDCECGCRG